MQDRQRPIRPRDLAADPCGRIVAQTFHAQSQRLGVKRHEVLDQVLLWTRPDRGADAPARRPPARGAGGSGPACASRAATSGERRIPGPPVIPPGRSSRITSITIAMPTRLVPLGAVMPQPKTWMPLLGVTEQDVEQADVDRADDGAPQARDAADDEHRQGEKGQVEVHLVGADAAEQVDVEAAGEPREGTREREREQPLPVDVDARRARRRGILAGRPQLAPEPAALVGERDRRSPRARRSSPASSRSVTGISDARWRRGRCCSSR